MLTVYGNDSIRRILRVRRRYCVPLVELCRLCLTSIPVRLGEMIKDLLLPTPPHMGRRRTVGQLKMLAAMIEADLEPLSGPRVFGYAQ